MIRFIDVRLARGAAVLVEDANLTIHAGYRVGVVGANGCGKSTLFALLLGELAADAGELECAGGLRFVHVAQETPALPRLAIEHVLDGDVELRDIEARLAAAAAAHDGVSLEERGHAALLAERQDAALLAEMHDRLAAIDGYSARARAATLLTGLGFSQADHGRPVSDFSGGFRMRLNLAQALIARADVLLLDEPTNHLDLDTVMWLEEWLRRYPGTLLVISHDRDFLDGVATHVLHFEASRVRLYSGNYTAFEVQRAQALALQQAAHQKQQREIARVRSFVDRFRAKATKARQAQSRLKLLARMQEIAPAHVDSPFTFGFRGFDANPSPLLALESVRAGYGDTTVLSGVNCSLLPGARIGLLGRNGAGKSTFIRLLAGTLAPLSGSVRAGRGLAVGYFAQHQLEQLREDDTALGHLARLAPDAREQDLRTFLGSFGFSSEEALAPVGRFSGGEKARLTLALIVWQRPNLLLLDEPTNHLDIDMRYALTQALQEYEGAVVLVSHDRHLLRATADDFLLVADGRVEPFPGDLDDYRAWLDTARLAATRPADGGAGSRRDERRAEAERRNALGRTVKPLEVECRRLEVEMSDLTARRQAADVWLASEAAYGANQRDRLQATLREQGDCLRRLEVCESSWLELQEEIEALAKT